MGYSRIEILPLLVLHALGFGGCALTTIMPGVTIRQLRDIGIEMQPVDRHALEAVFQSRTDDDRMKSILATLFLLTYNREKNRLEEGEIRERNYVRIIMQTGGEDHNKVEMTASEKAQLIAKAYYRLMAQFRDFYSSNKKLLTLDEALFIAVAYSEKEIFIEECICGKPILIQNKNTCDNTGVPHVNLFTCPWCESKGKKLFSFLEAKIARHENWVGHQARFKDDDAETDNSESET
jgi:hypothetical protein